MAADWRGVQSGLESGYILGRQTGGKLSALGSIIGKVADRLRSQREQDEELEQKRNILGMEEASKMRSLEKEAELEPKYQAIVDEKGDIVGYRPKGSVFQPSSMGFWGEETPEAIPPVVPKPNLPPAPTGRFNPLRALPGYADYGNDIKGAYNALRARGVSQAEAKKRLGLQ